MIWSTATVRPQMPNLRRVHADPESIALGMLADQRDGLGHARTDTLNRLHRILLDLIPGGEKKFLSARQARN
ncbi:hypothetical protein [Nocardia salmonicida]|uniref:hypothetical protein n=1 Tax=Nocardia salmonicida TaxID=53431 RepID=UPI0037B60568